MSKRSLHPMNEKATNHRAEGCAVDGFRAFLATVCSRWSVRRVLRRFKGQLKGSGKVMREPDFGIFKVGQTLWGLCPRWN